MLLIRSSRIFVFWLLGAAALGGWGTVPAAAQDGGSRRSLKNAERAARGGRGDEAAQIYQKVLLAQPNDPEANFGYGSFLLSRERELETARECLKKVYDVNPSYNPQLAFRLGRTLHLLGKYTEAVPLFEAAVQSLRNTPSADDLLEEDGPELRLLDASRRFSASALLLQSRKELDECRAALELQLERPMPAEVTALGPSLNTAFSEYAPVVNDNGRMLLFATRRSRAEEAPTSRRSLPHENIYYALRDEDGGWGTPKEVGRLNTRQHEAPLGFSPDGRNLYMYRDVNGGDIFVAKRTGEGTWAAAAPLGKPINSPYYEPSFCLSPDGKAAFFASDRPDGFGGLDLYITTRQPDGSWSPSFNLGASINTAYDEDSPFLSSDNSTLYFSSRGHNSIGGFDLFRSQTDGPLWGEPQNLGLNVNTPFDELYLTLGESDTEGFFASDRPGNNNKDLYAVRFGKWVPTDSLAPIQPVASLLDPTLPTSDFKQIISDTGPATAGVMFALSGKVIDGYTGQALPAELVVINRTTRQTVAVKRNDELTGRFRIMLPSDGTPYALEIQRPDYMFYTRNVDVPRQLVAEADLKDIALSKLDVGTKLVLNNLYFDYGKNSITSRSQPELKRLLTLLKTNPKLKIEIGGHTDNKGSAEFNQRLSEQRAASITKYLQQHGISANRLRAIGYGLRQPVASNDIEANRQRNRRTELKVLEN